MGEISDALRRARAERERGEKPETPPAAEPIAPGPGPIEFEAATPEPLPPPEHEGEPLRIPATRTGFWEARALEAAQPGAVTERFRHLALRVRRELEERELRSLVVTSALREEGKTVTACNLALALASMAAGRRMVLVDLDLRRPSVARGLGLRPDVGLDSVLRGEAPLEAACHPTSVPNLDVLPAISPMMHAHELLASPAFGRVIEELTRRYALVVADTPPVLLVPDVPLVMPHFGGALFVVRSGRTARSNLEEALALLPREVMLGIVMNETRLPSHDGQYGYYLRADAATDTEAEDVPPRRRRRRSARKPE